MAYYRAIGTGGTPQPQQVYLYNQGVDNTALTGGLTLSGYSYSSSYANQLGTMVFDSSDIALTFTGTANRNALTMGTTLKVNLTDIKSLIIKYRENNTSKQLSIDTTTFYSSYYVAITLQKTASGNLEIVCSIANQQGYVGDTNVGVAYFTRTENTIYIDSIELIPVERKDIVKNGVLANGQTIMEGYLNNGSHNGGFTISGNIANFANSSSDAYINASLFLSEKVDFTEHKNLHFEGKSITNSGSIRSKAEYVAVTQASPSSGGYTNAKTVVQSMDNAFSLDVDIASLSGEYYILYGNGTRYNNINQTIEFDNVYVE